MSVQRGGGANGGGTTVIPIIAPRDVPDGTVYVVRDNQQLLFVDEITVEGEFEFDGSGELVSVA